MLRPGLNGLARDLGAVKDFQPVADRVVKRNETGDAPLVGKRARSARHGDAGLFQPRGIGVDSGGILGFPAEERDTFAAVRGDHHALLAVVHTEGEASAALVHELEAKEFLAEACPVLKRLRADADIAQSLNSHRGLVSLCSSRISPPLIPA